MLLRGDVVRLDLACALHRMARGAYVRRAVLRELQRDGFATEPEVKAATQSWPDGTRGPSRLGTVPDYREVVT